MDEEAHLSSIDDDDRTYVSLSSEESINKCPIEYLILIFYGGELPRRFPPRTGLTCIHLSLV